MDPETKDQQKKQVDNNNKNANPVKHFYLVLYNASQLACWVLILLKGFYHVFQEKSCAGLHDALVFWLKVAQASALFEVLHAVFGLVRSSVPSTLLQVLGRNIILWVYIDLIMVHEDVKDTVGFPMVMFAWAISDVIRFSYYLALLLNVSSDMLTWCRYTLFIILYPVGVAGELICLVASLQIVTGTPSFILYFKYSSYFLLLLYVPGFGHLYTYMLRQRQKVLGKKKSS